MFTHRVPKARSAAGLTPLPLMFVAVVCPCSALWADGLDDPPVQVIVDMDLALTGMQGMVSVEAHPLVTHEVDVWIIDPLGTRTMYSIGYIGGINRGIAFGHTPTATIVGEVTAMTGVLGAPVHPDNWSEVIPTAWLDPAFTGPEVQYVEYGATAPGVISAAPSAPIFTATITIENAMPGDIYFFYLLDFPAIWTPGVGAFSTQSEFITLDTGGDAVPDQTVCAYGVDLDSSVPVPPASFLVNYIDGGNVGGAMLVMTQAVGDINADGVVDVLDLLALLGAWGPCTPPCPADLNGDGAIDVLDLLLLLGNWS